VKRSASLWKFQSPIFSSIRYKVSIRLAFEFNSLQRSTDVSMVLQHDPSYHGHFIQYRQRFDAQRANAAFIAPTKHGRLGWSRMITRRCASRDGTIFSWLLCLVLLFRSLSRQNYRLGHSTFNRIFVTCDELREMRICGARVIYIYIDREIKRSDVSFFFSFFFLIKKRCFSRYRNEWKKAMRYFSVILLMCNYIVQADWSEFIWNQNKYTVCYIFYKIVWYKKKESFLKVITISKYFILTY